jgi:hypothetical protein
MESEKFWNVWAVNGIKIFLCPTGNKLILLLTGPKPRITMGDQQEAKKFLFLVRHHQRSWWLNERELPQGQPFPVTQV